MEKSKYKLSIHAEVSKDIIIESDDYLSGVENARIKELKALENIGWDVKLKWTEPKIMTVQKLRPEITLEDASKINKKSKIKILTCEEDIADQFKAIVKNHEWKIANYDTYYSIFQEMTEWLYLQYSANRLRVQKIYFFPCISKLYYDYHIIFQFFNEEPRCLKFIADVQNQTWEYYFMYYAEQSKPEEKRWESNEELYKGSGIKTNNEYY